VPDQRITASAPPSSSTRAAGSSGRRTSRSIFRHMPRPSQEVVTTNRRGRRPRSVPRLRQRYRVHRSRPRGSALSNEVIGDPIVIRADGTPAYAAVVVDDALMEMPLIRGGDHLSNTPHQLLLYKASLRAAAVFSPLSWGRQSVVQASWCDVGRGIPREGLSARGARQLPRTDRLVAWRRHRLSRSRSWRAGFRSSASATGLVSSMKKSSPGSTGTT
jgi:hypothetical protein